MAAVEWEFQDTGRVLAASLECSGEPRLQNGKRGWYQVSDHIPWRLNWHLQVRCLIAEPKKDYKLPMPDKGQRKIILGTERCSALGSLDIDTKGLALSFRIPDCLDPPKKSFIWQGGIFLAELPFHCQIKLVMIDPKDGTRLRRVAATPARTGGIAFISPSGDDLGHIHDSEVRGRSERISAIAMERQSEYLMGLPDGARISPVVLFRILAEAQEFVDSRPSIPTEP
jgi:hypothetical protein